MIARIAGVNATRARGAVSFTVGHTRGGGKKIRVEDAFVLTRVTTDMPVNLVESIDKWKHLAGLDLADPDFGTPARVDVLLGADYYGEVLLRGRRWGPRGTPYAKKNVFRVGFSRAILNGGSPTKGVHMLRSLRERLVEKILGDRGL